MEEKYCKNCRNYYQHYVMNERRIFRVYCGHCTRYTKKRIKPDHNACDAFVAAQPDEYAFVSKEYLSKELLRYVLEMDLLPEIGQMDRRA